MSTRYLAKAASEVTTPLQSKPLNERQVANSAGGYSFKVDDWKRLDRFLILGSEGGSYYASENKLTTENLGAVKRCVESNGLRTVRRIVEISNEGCAPKNDAALLALAYAASKGDKETRSAALLVLPEVARISTHLFHFIAFVRQFRGWGRGLRRAVANWYVTKKPERLAEQVVKYQQRDGWSHKDLMRLRHINFKKCGRPFQAIAKWVVTGEESKSLPELIQGHIKLQAATDSEKAARLIRNYGLVRESVPTELLKDAKVWAALLDKMPMTAMIRNLGNMSKCGLLTPMSDASKLISERLLDKEVLQKARVHPIQLLIAAKTYEAGHGLRGTGEWTVVPKIVDALNDAYYLAFKNVVPTGKRFYLGMDISGSMWSGSVCGIPDFSPAVASGAMAMVTIQSEADYYAAGFTTLNGSYFTRHGSVMTPLSFSSHQRLDDVLKNMRALKRMMGGTDCALPMLDALEKRIPVDVFIVYTDSETWAGDIHPTQALEKYRQTMGIPAKLVVCGMVSNEFSIADPNDSGMLDVVGFDSSTPQIISEFARE